MKQYVKMLTFSLLLTSFSAFADIDYGGKATLLLGVEDAKYHTENRDYIYGDTSLFLDAKTEKTGDWSFGFYTEIESESDGFLKESYVYIQNNFARFEIGRAKNISEKMHIAIPDSTGLKFNRESYIYDLFDTKSVSLMSSSAITTDDHTQKISFITKPWNGFQVGGSYLPKIINKSQTSENILDEKSIDDGIIGAVKYKYDDGYFKFATSLGFARFNNLHNFQSDPLGIKISAEKREEINVGLNLNFGSWLIGFNAKKINETPNILASNSVSQEGTTWGAGIGYEFLMFNTNVSFQHTDIEGNKINLLNDKTDMFLWGLSYKYSADIKLWTGLGYAKFTDESRVGQNGNKGGFFTIGTSVDF